METYKYLLILVFAMYLAGAHTNRKNGKASWYPCTQEHIHYIGTPYGSHSRNTGEA